MSGALEAVGNVVSSVSSFLNPVAPLISIGGTLLSAYSQRQAGQVAQEYASQSAEAAKQAAEFEAKQQEYLAGQAMAASQREAYEQRRASEILASRALAVAAGSGAGASDPTVVDIISNIAGEGAYRSALALYEGQEEAKFRLTAAQARRMGGYSAAAAREAEGASISRASNLSMFSTLLRGGNSLLEKYGGSTNEPITYYT